jgi:hypothetical protein
MGSELQTILDEQRKSWEMFNKLVNNNDPQKEFYEKLMPQMGDTSGWTVTEIRNYYGFFIHGWYGRVSEAAYQEKENNERILAAKEAQIKDKMSKKSEKIVDKILNNLLDRCGIGNEIEACDDEVRQEMRQDLIKIVDKELK